MNSNGWESAAKGPSSWCTCASPVRAHCRASVCWAIVTWIITPLTQPVALSVGEDAANPYFCRRSAMPREEEMSSILKMCLIREITFLSILGVVAAFAYLALRWQYGDRRPILQPRIIMQCCHSGNLRQRALCAWAHAVHIYRQDHSGSVWHPHF